MHPLAPPLALHALGLELAQELGVQLRSSASSRSRIAPSALRDPELEGQLDVRLAAVARERVHEHAVLPLADRDEAWNVPSGLSRTSGVSSRRVRFTTATSSTLAKDTAWSAATIVPGSSDGREGAERRARDLGRGDRPAERVLSERVGIDADARLLRELRRVHRRLEVARVLDGRLAGRERRMSVGQEQHHLLPRVDRRARGPREAGELRRREPDARGEVGGAVRPAREHAPERALDARQVSSERDLEHRVLLVAAPLEPGRRFTSPEKVMSPTRVRSAERLRTSARAAATSAARIVSSGSVHTVPSGNSPGA